MAPHILSELARYALILRTAWVFSAHGRNFARAILNAAWKTDTLRVVADQRGTPTAAEDLAEGMPAIAARIGNDGFRPPIAAFSTPQMPARRPGTVSPARSLTWPRPIARHSR